MNKGFQHGFWVAAIMVLTVCQNAPMETSATRPGRRESPSRLLRHQVSVTGKLTVVYHEGDKALADVATSKLSSFFRTKVQVDWMSDMALKPTDLIGKAVLIIGDARHHLLEMLLKELPLQQTPSQFSLNGTTFDQPSDVVSMVLPNPADPTMPLFLLVGNESEEVYGFLLNPFSQGNVSVFRRSKVLYQGSYEPNTAGEWAFDATRWRSFDDQAMVALTTPRYRILNYRMAADQTQIHQILAQLNDTWTALEALFLQPIELKEPIDVYLYSRYEEKLRFFASYDQPSRYGNPTIRHFCSRYNELHLTLEPGLDDLGPAYLAGLLAENLAGKPLPAITVTGLSTLLAPNWGNSGSMTWAHQLAKAGWFTSLRELVTDRDGFQGFPFLTQPHSALVMTFLQKTWGSENFAKTLLTWEPNVEWCKSNQRAWLAFLNNFLETYQVPPKIERPRPFPAYAKGANHTFEGFSIDSGYLGIRSDAALTHLAEIGANSVAIVPYVRALKDSPVPLIPLQGVNKENDASIIHAAIRAKKLGMSVLLKPQLEGPWPGDIDMGAGEGWAFFFQYYRTMIRHYAVMAEIHQLPALSVGVELVHASKNSLFWRDLAKDLRQIYSGKLVYAANWGEEFERIDFWDAFDAIGVDCYYPLSAEDNPSDADLLTGARNVIARIDAVGKQFNKPMWLTEVGFASVEQPWKDPYRDRGKAQYDGTAQARCYQAIISAIEESTTLSGVWWWKWHSDGRAGQGDRSFSCQDKPAETLLAQWLSSR